MAVVAREFFVSGGTLPLDSESYIERSADRELLDHLAEGRYCYVLNSRQMGKSSLSVRTIARLGERGIRTVFIDLTQIGGRNVQAAQWYAGLTNEVGRAVGRSAELLRYFKAHDELSPMQRFFGAIREVVLQHIAEPLVIFVDEIDATRNLPFDTDEFFAGIRECYNRRVRDERSRRLTFCLLGVAVPNDLIRDPATTPFNIGERIPLQDFKLAEIRGFAAALGGNGERLARRVHYWTNGQPFLTQSLCREIAADPAVQDEATVDALVHRLFFGPKALDTNLNLADVANRVLSDPENSGDPDRYRADILSAYERVWRGGAIRDDEANRVAVVLKLSGLLAPDGARLIVRNRIYHHVFDRAWIQTNMPGQELVRQRQSFRRGLLRGVAVTALLGGVIGTLALVAVRERMEAIAAKSALDYELYVADINSLRLFEGIGDGARMAAILQRTQKSVHRNFEWNFWLGRLHDSPEEYTLDYSSPGKLEWAVPSQDGRQICIRDRLADVAVVMDRRTKRVLGSLMGDRQPIVASSAGFLTYDHVDCPSPVREIATGRIVSRIGTPGYHLEGEAPSERSDLVLLTESVPPLRKTQFVEIWDIRKGIRRFRHTDPEGMQTDFHISRDGRRFTYSEPPVESSPGVPGVPRQLVVWDVPSDRQVDKFPLLGFSHIGSLSDSGRLLVYWDEHRLPKVRDLDSGKIVYSTLGTGEDVPISIEVAPDEKSMACINSDGVASIREIPSGRVLAVRSNLWQLTPSGTPSQWIGASSSVRVLDFSPRGQGIVGAAQKVARDGHGAIRLMTEGVDSVGRVSDPAVTALLALPIPKGAKDLTYNGFWSLVSGPGNAAQIVSVDGSQAPIRIPYDLDNFACGVRTDVLTLMDKTRTFIGIAGDPGIELWRVHFDPTFRGIWMSPDDHRLIASTGDGDIAAIDPRTGRILRRVGAHKLSLSSLNFSPDSRVFVTGGGDGTAILWDADTLERKMEFRGNAAQQIEGADISPDGHRVATCNVTGAWQIWDSATGEELIETRASSLPLRAVTFTSDGRKLLTSGDDGLVRCWAGIDRDPTVRIPVPALAAKNVGR